MSQDLKEVSYAPKAGTGFLQMARFLVDYSSRDWVKNTWAKEKGNLTRLSKAIEEKFKQEGKQLKAETRIYVVADLGYYIKSLRLPSSTLHLAWAVDDGPTAATNRMRASFRVGGRNRPATWYIVRDRLTDHYINNYIELQNQGHEIAIHGLHPKRNHLSWLPSGTLPSYNSIEDALIALKGFKRELNNKGLYPKFVRLPYGLFTELVHSLNIKGMQKAKFNEKAGIARSIIKSGVSSTGSAPKNKVAREFQALQSGLNTLGLKLWGGRTDGNISNNSW